MLLNTKHRTRRTVTASLTAALAGLAAAAGAWGAAPASADPSSGTPTCTVGDLYVSLGGKQAAAGSLYQTLRFTNTATHDCALRGYPGVSVLDTAHRQIGPAADRSGRSYSTVVLRPAESASAVVRTANGPVGGACERTGSYLRVYPPASRTAVLVPASFKACSGIFDVGPVNTHGAF
ncbi:DUF4232 domain-containing protein [Streptomyces sp. MS06]|uniref:DUF4232 domain-containing protein n=1 Tax=Streptomyces sp. MS06 TaxID=3385974 RepID=UPI0039A33449